jgi:hypothetical protein
VSTNQSVLLSTAYLAPIQYYSKLFSYDKIYIEYFENYLKQSYRNRIIILSANGSLSLTIPIKRSNSDKILTKDVIIDNQSRWKAIHLRAIESAYRSSPFFIYYFDELKSVFDRNIELLIDFNQQLQTTILELINLKVEIIYTSKFKSIAESFDDYAELIHPKLKKLAVDKFFKPVSYYQVFGLKFGFIPNLSIIDLLFNMGPETIDILKKSLTLK